MLKKNFSLTRGDSEDYIITFSHPGGTPYNITGWTIFFSLKTNFDLDDADASLRKVITSHTDPTNGITTISLVPADTASLEPRDYDYDVKILLSDGKVKTLLKGKFTLDYRVTTSTGTSGTAGTAGT